MEKFKDILLIIITFAMQVLSFAFILVLGFLLTVIIGSNPFGIGK